MKTKYSNNKIFTGNMKSNFILKLTLPVLLVFGLSSCSDDFLEQVNPNSLTNESFWKNNNDLNSGLNSVYSALSNTNILGIKFEPLRTDIGVDLNFRRNGVLNPMYAQTFNLTNKDLSNKWNALYLGVFRANQVIGNYEEIKEGLTADQKVTALLIVAQARALRGYFYYVLNASYNNGNVMLLDFIPETFADLQQSPQSSQVVKDFYREDLRFGLAHLPKDYQAWQDINEGSLGRVTAGFCEALLGKSYILDNDFSNAKIYLKNVIDNYSYSLMPDLADCFTGISEFNSESIFEINYTTNIDLLLTGEQALSQDITHFIGGGQIQPSTWLNLQYRNEKPDPSDPANIRIDAPIYDAAGEVIGTEDRPYKYSHRMGNSMAHVDDMEHLHYGVTPAELGPDGQNAPTMERTYPALFKKFTHWNTIGGGLGEPSDAENQNKSGINLPIMRLADVYLMYSECMLEEGNLSEALRYINRVRKRSHLILLGKATDPGAEFNNLTTTYMDDIHLGSGNVVEEVNTTNLMEHLRFVERPLELALEGNRSYHLRRWGVYKQQLQKLAGIVYDSWTYPKNLNGVHKDRWKNFMLPALTGAPGQNPDEEPYYLRDENGVYIAGLKGFHKRQAEPAHPNKQDCVVGADKFIASEHSYFPLPQAEVEANLNWDK
ncbi:RagB/SusD family nutrient uptake outer membrane protein [Flavicella marina]|uniref:RagB/SusD family nutrient uptake outer membrane protein n=1 Tax=Flavicella marina TaxID=1475951 RepID=UPI00186B03E9|nr:RagB/SusD family nutrient uptake outer membrane protein [Flavicella marina]